MSAFKVWSNELQMLKYLYTIWSILRDIAVFVILVFMLISWQSTILSSTDKTECSTDITQISPKPELTLEIGDLIQPTTDSQFQFEFSDSSDILPLNVVRPRRSVVGRQRAELLKTQTPIAVRDDEQFSGGDDRERQRGSRRKKEKQRNKQRTTESKESKLGSLHLQIAKNPQVPKPVMEVTDSDKPIGPWVVSTNTSYRHIKIAEVEEGTAIRIKKKGLYYLYSQFTYFDRSGRWAHVIEVNGVGFIKCVTSEAGLALDQETNLYFNTIQHCYMGAPFYLNEGDKLSIRSLYAERSVTMDPLMTFWGIVKLA